MKKIFLVVAILIANGVFMSCTDLDENLENNPDMLETFLSEGEDGQNPEEEEEEDSSNGG
jgi:hypothetical protein